MDPTGAVVRGARVSLVRQSDGAVVATSVSGLYGIYRLEAAPGEYELKVQAAGFAPFESGLVSVAAKASVENLRVDAWLQIAPVVEDVDVGDAAPEPTRSGRDVALTRHEVQQLPLDPVAFKQELLALAGNSSAQILVDGFSGGAMPPRNSIRGIRINQNPYSAENDTDTVTGVIQILTAPGAKQLHGNAYLYGDDSALNATNPFAPEQGGYYADGTGADVSGSVGKRTNLYGRIDYMQQKTNAAVNALVLNGAAGPAEALYAVPNPLITLDTAARTDVKASSNDTVVLRYSLHKAEQSNVGVGQLALQSQGLDERTFVHTLQLANTLVLGPRVVDETRLQYIRTRTTDTPASTAATLRVQGAFTGGGNAQGGASLHQDGVEFQQNVSVSRDRHFVSVGGRLRLGRYASFSQDHFNGEFVFDNLAAYETTVTGMEAGWNAAQIAAAGGGAGQYVVATGDASASVAVTDGAVFAQDNWKLRQNLKLSYGLRYETQNFIDDHADWAPRVGFSWGLGGNGGVPPRYVVHGGAGVFYQRFGTPMALQVERFNGTRQVEYVVDFPQFCPAVVAISTVQMSVSSGCAAAPPASTLFSTVGATVYRVNPRYHAPYFIEGSAGLDRQIGGRGTIGLTYLQTRGVRMQYAENANAPLPGTYVPGQPTSGTRPAGNTGNIFQYNSEGYFRSRQLTANGSLRGGRLSLSGNYTLRFSNDDAESNGLFPLNRFDLGADYGRASTDVRHVGVLNGGLTLPYRISSWAMLRVASGAPFNIVLGDDLNGDTQYNDRPAFATDLARTSVIRTRWGSFDTQPIPGQTIIPRNFAQGPGALTLNVELGKSIAIGPRAMNGSTPGERKYTAELQVLALNVLNHPNLTPPVAVLGTPLFGRSVGVVSGGSLSPARALDLQLAIEF